MGKGEKCRQEDLGETISYIGIIITLPLHPSHNTAKTSCKRNVSNKCEYNLRRMLRFLLNLCCYYCIIHLALRKIYRYINIHISDPGVPLCMRFNILSAVGGSLIQKLSFQ